MMKMRWMRLQNTWQIQGSASDPQRIKKESQSKSQAERITMEFNHYSVLLNETIENLNIKPDGSIAQIRFRILIWAIFLRSGKRRECLWKKRKI